MNKSFAVPPSAAEPTPRQIGAAVLLYTCLTAGCSSPVLRSMHVKDVAGAALPGLVYALPKAQVQIELVRVKVDPEALKKAKKTAAEAAVAVDAADKAKSEAVAAAQEAEGIAKYATGAGRAHALSRQDRARAAVQLRDSELQAAKAAKQLADAALTAAAERPSDFEQSVSLKALPPVPDPRGRFILQLDKMAPTRDQNIKLTISNGLLNTSGATSTGQLGSIMVSLASAIAGVSAKLTESAESVAQATEAKQAAAACVAKREVQVFDPTAKDEVDEIEKLLRDNFDNSFVLKRESRSTENVSTQTGTSAPWLDGLAYRAPRPLTLSVLARPEGPVCSGKVKTVGAVLAATVPDASSYYVLPVDANSFTTAKTDIVFSDGMPISYSSDQPSQLAAIARIPVDMLKAAISVPAELIKLRVDYSSQKASLTEKEAAELDAKLKLLESQQALKEKQDGSKTATTPPGSP